MQKYYFLSRWKNIIFYFSLRGKISLLMGRKILLVKYMKKEGMV